MSVAVAGRPEKVTVWRSVGINWGNMELAGP